VGGLLLRPAVELHPDDARRLGLFEGDTVTLASESGAASNAAAPCPVAINPLLAPGCAFGAANALGLRLAADAPGLPAVTLVKAQAPTFNSAATPTSTLSEEVAPL
jgi:anaerobic selenocysteine-containing dehydrogenase